MMRGPFEGGLMRASRAKNPASSPVTTVALYRKPGHLIRRCQQIAVAIFMEEAASFDLTPVQYAALVAIRNQPGIDVTRLSSVIAFDRSTLGNVVERLEGKGWIARRTGTEDRRTKKLVVTSAGVALLDAVQHAVDRAQERMLAKLPAAERKRFVRLLELFVDINNAQSRAPLRPHATTEKPIGRG
jgi:DNA-binding MarR family transcriptional regulator